jgi:hypothetical protein
MAFDEGLAERIRGCLADYPGISEKRMFGGLAFMVDGKMCVGTLGSDLMARVGPANYKAALAEPHVQEMDFTGRPLTGFVRVDAEGVTEEADLQRWCDLSVAFARSAEPSKKRT